MKNATKKKVANKAAAKKPALKKAPIPAALVAARESLGAIAERESVGIDVENLVIAVLSNITSLVRVDPATGDVTPFGILAFTFGDPKVGLDDEQMKGFYAALSTAIGVKEVADKIAENLASNPTASAIIRDVVDVVQSWVNSSGANQ